MIIVVGAGLAGLSAAWHLAERGLEFAVFEKEPQPGGYCRSYINKKHTFDLAGHFLHLRTDEIEKLVKKVAPEGISLRERRASIMIGDARIPFPFQAHLGFLPKEEVAECLSGYVRALLAKRSTREKTFGKWLRATFGEGMYRVFFKPYNEKFWKRDLDDILIDWASWSVPQPEIEQVVRGALGLQNTGLGYNPKFYYPEDGGIGFFTSALASRVKNLTCDNSVKRIHTKRKKILLASGDEVSYDHIINTASLPRLFAIIEDAPSGLKNGAEKLDWRAVDCVQLGFKRTGLLEEDWIYIPDEKYPFYRVGKYPGSVIDAGTSVFVEFTRRKDEKVPEHEKLIATAVKGLVDLKLIDKNDRPNVSEVITMNPAYVVYDKHRRWFMPKAGIYLQRQNIMSIGRYGAWEYSAMEDALLAGKRAAEAIPK